jgi:hypothetical protein
LALGRCYNVRFVLVCGVDEDILRKLKGEQQRQKLEYEAMEVEAKKVIRDPAGTGSVVTLAHGCIPLSVSP